MNSTKIFRTKIGLKSNKHYFYQLLEIGYNKTGKAFSPIGSGQQIYHNNLNATPENGLNPRPRFEATYSQRD